MSTPPELNVLLPFFKLGSQLLLAILDFKVCHIELEHPVTVFVSCDFLVDSRPQNSTTEVKLM
jgi:hypothetical protein